MATFVLLGFFFFFFWKGTSASFAHTDTLIILNFLFHFSAFSCTDENEDACCCILVNARLEVEQMAPTDHVMRMASGSRGMDTASCKINTQDPSDLPGRCKAKRINLLLGRPEPPLVTKISWSVDVREQVHWRISRRLGLVPDQGPCDAETKRAKRDKCGSKCRDVGS